MNGILRLSDREQAVLAIILERFDGLRRSHPHLSAREHGSLALERETMRLVRMRLNLSQCNIQNILRRLRNKGIIIRDVQSGFRCLKEGFFTAGFDSPGDVFRLVFEIQGTAAAVGAVQQISKENSVNTV